MLGSVAGGGDHAAERVPVLGREHEALAVHGREGARVLHATAGRGIDDQQCILVIVEAEQETLGRPGLGDAGCRRVDLEELPVHHNYIKRFVADWEMSLPKAKRAKPTCLPDTGKKVAIVGGGPAGLSAAYYLRRLGHHPTIFDSKPGLGGMMRYGIPEYRLPKKTLDFEIQEILDLGVDVRLELEFGRDFLIEDLEQEFEAILVALGAWDNSSLRCDGEDLDGVWKGTEFLEKRELGIRVDLTGQRIVVVGGGNTAMDACR